MKNKKFLVLDLFLDPKTNLEQTAFLCQDCGSVLSLDEEIMSQDCNQHMYYAAIRRVGDWMDLPFIRIDNITNEDLEEDEN